jgi:hypothetical protein
LELTLGQLNPGETARFTNRFAAIAHREFTGDVRFLGKVSGRRWDNLPFDSADVIGKPTRIGSIGILRLEPVQVLYDAPLVAGKPLAVRVTLTNTLLTPHAVHLDLGLDAERFTERLTAVPPGVSSFVLPKEAWFLPRRSELLSVNVLQIGDSVQEPLSFPGGSVDQALTVRTTLPMRIRWLALEFAPKYGLSGTSWARAQAIAAATQPYVNAVFPGPPQEEVITLSLLVDYPDDIPLDLFNLMWQSSDFARSDGFDRSILVLPPHPQVWLRGPEGQVVFGLTHPGMKQSAIQDGIEETNPIRIHVPAHELGHTFGFADEPHPAGPAVRDGHWVERHLAIPEAYQLMAYHPAFHWIGPNHYRELVDAFSRPRLDPEALVVSGLVDRGGAVRAGNWRTITTENLTPDDPTGTHTVRLLDASGGEMESVQSSPEPVLHAAGDFIG